MTEVRRVVTGTGSHIEPPLDPAWPDLDKLRWKAAVVLVNTGVAAHVEEQPSGFVLSGLMFSYGPEDYAGMWSVLNGIEIGHAAALRGGES